MSILTMRSCKRYAVRQPLSVRRANGAASQGLLIELAQEGCRISSLEATDFTRGDVVVLALGETSLGGVVRWTGAGAIGIRFETALYASQLNDLIALGRRDAGTLRYGT